MSVVDRKLLAQALRKSKDLPASQSQQDLLDAQQISRFAANSENFGNGNGGNVGLAAQLATAGIGAYSQYKAKKQIAQNEALSQQSFAAQFPQFASLAGQLSPETREAYTIEALKSTLPKVADNQIISTDSGYFSVDKSNPNQSQPVNGPNGQILRPQKPASTTVNVGEQQNFKNATTLRGEYLNNSKNFQDLKTGYEKVVTSAKDPSAAGDLSLIFGYMKTLDPGSTVREGEFATAEQAGSIPDRVIALYNKALKGTRLSNDQRNDFVDRSTRLYNQANQAQQKTVKQYTDIANRNGLNPNDVIVDFSTTIESPTQNISSQSIKEGTVIKNKAGQRKILKGGAWQDL